MNNILRMNDIKIINIPQKRQKLNRLDFNDPIIKERKNEQETMEFFLKKGIVDNNFLEHANYMNIKNVWLNEPCFIVGAGPALKEFIAEVGFDFLNGKHTIGINHVIEDYDKFEWFFFLDKRFLERTTYNINNYKGRIFAQATTGLKTADNITVFFCQGNKPTLFIEKGLYNGNLSGLSALNLALITGANPIYLLGFGEGKSSSFKSYHYKNNYTGEVKTDKVYQKFIRVKKQYSAFSEYADRIIHVTEGNDIKDFKKMRIEEFKRKFKLNKPVAIKTIPRICHLSFSDRIEDHADITREIINKGFGDHYLYDVNKGNVPNADLYIFEHFISTKIKADNFQYKHKAIDIVHTTNCIPVGNWKKIIVLTEAWKKYLNQHGINNNINVITGGINLDDYKDINPDYNNQIFGRITRWSPGKIHPEWNKIVGEILTEIQESKCLIYTQLDNVDQRPPLKHERMIYDKSVKIDDFKGNYLKNLSIYVHANGSFKETMSHAVIEAMATGLPIIYLSEPAIDEIMGNAGIKCANIQEVKKNIILLLKDKGKKEYYGALSKERSQKFHVNNFLNGMNKIIKECLN